MPAHPEPLLDARGVQSPPRRCISAVASLPGIRLLEARQMVLGRWWSFPACHDRFWRLYRNDAPGAALITRGRRIDLPAHRVLLIPPATAFSCLPTEGIRHLFLHFEPLAPLAYDGLPYLAPADREVTRLAAELAHVLPVDGIGQRQRQLLPAVGWMALACIAAALADVDAAKATGMTPPHDEAADAIEGALPHIDAHLAEPLYTAALAIRCRLSEEAFVRGFARRTGLSPSQYIQQRRCALAASLLHATTATLTELALQCGFADRSHLSRCFQRWSGMSPSTYRTRTPDV